MIYPLVSVVMPVYNSARSIDNAVNSVKLQKYTNWELIVVDGGSSDNTVQIISNLSYGDKRIRLVNNKNDKGPAHARSTGIKEARGEYIAFLDGDDLWISSKLSKQIKFMEETKSVFSYTQYRIIDKDGEYASQVVSMKKRFSYWSALFFRGIATPTVVAKRNLFSESILRINNLSHGEDYIWWLLILREGVSANGLMKPLSLYRDMENSLSKNRLKHLICVWETYIIILKLPKFLASIAFFSYLLNVMKRRMSYRLRTMISGTIIVNKLMM